MKTLKLESFIARRRNSRKKPSKNSYVELREQMNRRLPDSDKYMSLGGIFLEDYLAEFDIPARMRLTVSHYGIAGVAGARHYYGKLEYCDDQCLVSIDISRPTLLVEREANEFWGDD